MFSVVTLNLFALFLSIIVSAAVIMGNFHRRTTSFYVMTMILLIPIFAQVRQLLMLYDLLHLVPWYLLIVYIFLRSVGPLVNFHVHLQLDKKFNLFSWINLFTYAAFLYILYIGFKLFLSNNYDAEKLISTFKDDNLLSITYPILQLLHFGEALSLLHSKPTESRKGLIYFMRTSIIVVIIMLIFLQVMYFTVDRFTVEMIIAPIIFIIVYSAILIISMKYSALFESIPTIKPNNLLSQRENDVMQKLIAGKTDKEIADELHLSVNTIATYCRRIYTKLEVKNRTEATRKYLDT